MKSFVILSVMLLIAIGGYAYSKNPTGCAKIGTDFVALFYSLLPSSPSPAQDIASSAPTSTSTNAAPAPTSPPPKPVAAATNLAPTAPAPVTTTPAPAPVAAAPSPTPTPFTPWTAPDPIPAQPNWTWTTQDGTTYQNVVITKIEPNAITITHSAGVAHLDPATLPPDLQKLVNYDPAARAAATTEAQAEQWTTDYNAALAQAKASNKLVLLDFTGSDWCGYCKAIDMEVFTQPSFKTFAAQNYVLVTLDFPQQIALPAALKQQNQALALQFHISGYPTLIVVDPQGKELGRSTGYNPGSGPDPVIAELKSFSKS